MCFSQRHELAILKLPYLYTRIEQIINILSMMEAKFLTLWGGNYK